MVGWKQRVQASHVDRSRSPNRGASSSTSASMPPQLRSWLFKWAWGKSSAFSVVENAKAYVDEHGRKNLDDRISKLLKAYLHPQNAQRALDQVLPLSDMVRPTSIDNSMINIVLPPFDFFHWMRQANSRKFAIHMGAKAQGLEEWWTRFLQRPAAGEYWHLHPWLRNRTPAELKWHVP